MADWLPEENDIVTRLWREGKTVAAIQAALPRRRDAVGVPSPRRSLQAIQTHARRSLKLPLRQPQRPARGPGEDRG